MNDNSTDRTGELAAAAGATVLTTENNTARKAGALNQALRWLLPQLDADDVVLVQDADSALDERFTEHGLRHLRAGYGAVGGVFRGGPGGGFVGHLQRNEYARYARDVSRMNGKCLVVTGTAAMFPAGVLRAVSSARLSGALPAGDGDGGVYDTTVLTEDNELTFALLHMGHRVISPAECALETEVMESWRALWRQRLRWKRGSSRCGWGISLIFVVERVVTVRHRGWRRMLLAAAMYELVLDYFLQACHAKAYLDALRRAHRAW